MRRLISICLLMFFCLGPLSAAFQTNDESRLPACCRRHGAHHCNMPDSAAQIAAASSNTPVLLAPPHCPEFPRSSFAADFSTHAFLTATSILAAQRTNEHTPAASQASARINQQRTRGDRGPPALSLA